jgi:hypothetical protein
MTDEPRPAPQYGEYATPEEVAKVRGTQTPPEPPAGHPEPVRRPAPRPMPRSTAGPTARSTARPSERPRRAWDVPLTVGLLALGFLFTLQSIEGFLNFSSTVTQMFARTGLDLEFGQEADAAGIILLLIHFALLLTALGVSVALLRAHRLAFWVPLTAGALATIAYVVTLFVLMLANPAYTSLVFDRP